LLFYISLLDIYLHGVFLIDFLTKKLKLNKQKELCFRLPIVLKDIIFLISRDINQNLRNIYEVNDTIHTTNLN
jgi:hypothetical protein